MLNDWLPDATVRTGHRRSANAGPDALWKAATGIRLGETRRLGRLVGWRIPGVKPSQTYAELFREYPFTVLDESEHGLVSGLVGRIWTLARDYPALEGPDAGDGAEVCSEARVEPVDTVARLRLKAIWTVVGPFERLVGAEPLALAVRRAENAA